MKPEQQREILEAAAKVCGISGSIMGSSDIIYEKNGIAIYWNPLTNSADTARMCAKLDINTFFGTLFVSCWTKHDPLGFTQEHDGTDASKEAAWRLAASIVAAKVGGYEDA